MLLEGVCDLCDLCVEGVMMLCSLSRVIWKGKNIILKGLIMLLVGVCDLCVEGVMKQGLASIVT